MRTDEEKIEEHLASKGVTEVKKERKKRAPMSPEEYKAACERLERARAARKANLKPVTMVVRRTEEPILESEDDEPPVGNEDAPVEAGAMEQDGVVLENGVKQMPDGSYKL
jgi:hypothetical protein